MNHIEFNERYKQYLEDGYPGLEIREPSLISYLNYEFNELKKITDFKYRQIKEKYGYYVLYCSGVSKYKVKQIEDNLLKIKKDEI